jgi:hypothetical protein
MTDSEIRKQVNNFESVSDEDLRRGLAHINFRLDEEKFIIAGSCYGATVVLGSLTVDTFRRHFGLPAEATDIYAERIRIQGSIVLRAYVCFVFMRSDELEQGLDNVPEESPLWPFRNFFRKGNPKKGDDSIAQHIRNSLAHGSFRFARQEAALIFEDRGWKAKMDVNLIDRICAEVKRFYWCAYEITHNIKS